MQKPTYAEHIVKRWRTILLFGVVAFFIITASIIFFLPFEFKANTQVFIMTRNVGAIDSYTSVKSSERLGENLTRLIETSTFLDMVLEAKKDEIDTSTFPTKPSKILRKWKNMVQTSVVPGSGLLRISVFHTQREQAQLIAQTISDVLSSRGREYTGFDVDIRQVDAVFTSTLPSRPSIPLNALLSFILGSILGAVFVVVEEERMLKF